MLMKIRFGIAAMSRINGLNLKGDPIQFLLM